MLTRERSGAPPFLKLSPIRLISCLCTHHRLERIDAFCFVPISLFVLSVSPKPGHPLLPLAGLAEDEEPRCTRREAGGGGGLGAGNDGLKKAPREPRGFKLSACSRE